MQRRLLAAVAAFVIAAVGAIVLVSYARSADARAQAGEQLVPVLVVGGSTVPAGTAAGEVAGAVRTEQVPARLAAPGSLTDLSAVDGFVTTADLLPGEQLIQDRFTDPASLLPAGTVAAPVGTQEVSLTLQPQQAVDGALKAGDRVGVLVLGKAAAGDPAPQSIDGVLVTRSTGGGSATPNSQVTVTLALDGPQSAAVIAGMQQGTIWLSLQEIAGPATTPGTTVAATSSAGAQS